VSAPLRVVGHSVPRTDALEKVTGRARYVTDLELPGMLHAKLVRSPYAHARIVRLDPRAAAAVPGVRAVVGCGDLSGCDPFFGPAFRDRPILAVVRGGAGGRGGRRHRRRRAGGRCSR
jgi:CO/xanthine dehydrogenase Mo-binding subunit